MNWMIDGCIFLIILITLILTGCGADESCLSREVIPYSNLKVEACKDKSNHPSKVYLVYSDSNQGE